MNEFFNLSFDLADIHFIPFEEGICIHIYTHTYMHRELPVLCCAKLLQSYLILCDPMDCSSPGFSVHEILQARILEWVALSSSRGSSVPGVEPLSCISRWVLYHQRHLGSPQEVHKCQARDILAKYQTKKAVIICTDLIYDNSKFSIDEFQVQTKEGQF